VRLVRGLALFRRSNVRTPNPSSASGYHGRPAGRYVRRGDFLRFLSSDCAAERSAAEPQVDEPTPGRVLTETNLDTGVVTRFSVEPVDGGERTIAAMTSDMTTGAGLRGLVDRWMLPRMTRHIFEQQLEQLARYMRSRDAPT
jgi:hypothetical protein